VPLHLQCVCGCFAVPTLQGWQLSVRFSTTIAGCNFIPAFSWLCPGKTTHYFVSSWSLAQGVLMGYRVSSIAARKYPPLAILAIFKVRCVSDCSCCTQPPCLDIVAVMLKTNKPAVVGSKYEIGYCLNHIHFRSLLQIYEGLFGPLFRTLITGLISDDLRVENITMFNFTNCAAKIPSSTKYDTHYGD
jgi:hypothetical protein